MCLKRDQGPHLMLVPPCRLFDGLEPDYASEPG